MVDFASIHSTCQAAEKALMDAARLGRETRGGLDRFTALEAEDFRTIPKPGGGFHSHGVPQARWMVFVMITRGSPHL